ncbi:MAG: FkbM family methyltransferase [Gaiella sp.]
MRTGRVHAVWVRNGVLTYRYPGGIYTVRGMGTPAELESQTRDLFLWDYTPAEGDVVVDCGAGSGTEALVLASVVGEVGQVVAIEAHPASFAKLELVRRLNRLRNVSPVHAAVTDTLGVVRISDLPNDQANSIVGVHGRSGVDVPAERLDHLLPKLGIERIDLLKMNIEGAELRALQGLGEYIHRVRHIVVACHDFAAARGEEMLSLEPVRAFLEGAGFEVRRRADERYWVAHYLYASRRGTAARPC